MDRVEADTLVLRCGRCDREFAGSPRALDCPRCHDAAVLLPQIKLQTDLLYPVTSDGIWKFAAALPPVPREHQISLGEGGTPLIELRDGAIRVKFEGNNPTQSYKDRFSAVNVSVAKWWDVAGVALISTGNAGLAAAAYGAAAGIPVRVLCSPSTPAFITRGIRDFGADLRTGDPTELRRGLEESISDGYLPGSRSVPFTSVTPFGSDGYTTIAYEIAAELGDAPAAVVVPVGGGDGIYGVGRGFRQLFDSGLTSRMPTLYGARTTSSRAPSISGDAVGEHAIATVADSGGRLVDVVESRMIAAVGVLAEHGLSAEPASSTSVAAALDLGLADVVCVVTGGGLKWRELV